MLRFLVVSWRWDFKAPVRHSLFDSLEFGVGSDTGIRTDISPNKELLVKSVQLVLHLNPGRPDSRVTFRGDQRDLLAPPQTLRMRPPRGKAHGSAPILVSSDFTPRWPWA